MDYESQLSVVRIRKFVPSTDAEALTKIWVKGLDQTSNAKFWITRQWWKDVFDKYAAKAISEDGDMGPNGANLEKQWCLDEKNRCMLVAEIVSPEYPSKLVGCCGIIRGADSNPKDINENETTFSIWKMSVDESCQGKGVGGKLMKEVEKWAKENGCIKLRMITTNPIASRFYQKHGYEWTEWTYFEWFLFQYMGGYIKGGKWHEKEL